MKTIKMSIARLLEITNDYNLMHLITEDNQNKHITLEYDNIDNKWHSTLEFTKEIVENSGVSVYNFYTDDNGNYYYPITVESEDVE